jgi:uncharacterized membrane protein
MGAKIAYEEWDENKALCAYCQAATAASVASLAIAMPELLRAARQLPDGDAVERMGELVGS